MPYKLQIPDSSNWKKDTDNPMVNGFRELMEYNNQFVDDPNVGIFWYDPEEDELFGVYPTLASDMNFFYSNIFNAEVRTCRLMHYALWQRECNRGKDKRFQEAIPFFKYPRGRIFEVKNRGFVACVGSWMNQFPQAKQMIIDEFQLPNNTEFLINVHLGLGHNWSDKEM